VLVEERGVPLSIAVTGANRHDVTQLEIVLDNIVIERPELQQISRNTFAAAKAMMVNLHAKAQSSGVISLTQARRRN
jgi:hypothetical protein